MSGCWHCGEPLPPDPPQASVAGVAHAVCCNGCRAVAEWIGDLGLADYYRLRTDRPRRAPDPGESARERGSLARPELARHVVRDARRRQQRGDRARRRHALHRMLLADRAHARAACRASRDVGVNAGARRARIVFDAARCRSRGSSTRSRASATARCRSTAPRSTTRAGAKRATRRSASPSPASARCRR